MINNNENEKVISINDYFERINRGLAKYQARIKGEIVDVTLYPGRSYLFFKIKDKDIDNPAVLTCIMWKRDYDISGIEIVEGLEIIITGFSSIHKESGRFSFNAKSIELVGEGALKLAYDKLKLKLEKEGMFGLERKRKVVDLPERIGLITSKDGAVIHDFQSNIGKFGFKIKFFDTRVEGALAVREIISAIDYFSKTDIEVLIIIRGGGSLESMQAFNNEVLVRKIAEFNKPVLCGIGHDKDIPLASLVADVSVSTPTAAANFLNESWKKLEFKLKLSEQNIFNIYKENLEDSKNNFKNNINIIQNAFQNIFLNFNKAEDSLNFAFRIIKDRIFSLNNFLDSSLLSVFKKLNFSVSNLKEEIYNQKPNEIFKSFENLKSKVNDQLLYSQKQISIHDPKRQLRLGYSIVMKNGIILKTSQELKAGDIIEVNLFQGNISSEVKSISN